MSDDCRAYAIVIFTVHVDKTHHAVTTKVASPFIRLRRKIIRFSYRNWGCIIAHSDRDEHDLLGRHGVLIKLNEECNEDVQCFIVAKLKSSGICNASYFGGGFRFCISLVELQNLDGADPGHLIALVVSYKKLMMLLIGLSRIEL